MRTDTIHKHGLTRYELRDGARGLITFDSLAGDEKPGTAGGK